MNRNLSPEQFPHYEVGGSEGEEYTSEDKVSPSAYGLRIGGEIGRYTTKGMDPHARVPVSSLRAVQTYVYAPHVENLASVPAHVLERSNEWDPPRVVKYGDEHMISDGHHRAAAAIKRGDPDMEVYVEGTME